MSSNPCSSSYCTKCLLSIIFSKRQKTHSSAEENLNFPHDARKSFFFGCWTKWTSNKNLPVPDFAWENIFHRGLHSWWILVSHDRFFWGWSSRFIIFLKTNWVYRIRRPSHMDLLWPYLKLFIICAFFQATSKTKTPSAHSILWCSLKFSLGPKDSTFWETIAWQEKNPPGFIRKYESSIHGPLSRV